MSNGAVFVEFCCSRNSQIKRAAKALGIEYLGFSKDWVNRQDPAQFAQVLRGS